MSALSPSPTQAVYAATKVAVYMIYYDIINLGISDIYGLLCISSAI